MEAIKAILEFAGITGLVTAAIAWGQLRQELADVKRRMDNHVSKDSMATLSVQIELLRSDMRDIKKELRYIRYGGTDE